MLGGPKPYQENDVIQVEEEQDAQQDWNGSHWLVW
jgi:hypothetical protein